MSRSPTSENVVVHLFAYPTSASPFFRVYVDEPRRVSTCRACRTPIKKKTKRVVFAVNTWSRTYQNGGRTSHQRFFLHSACAKKMFSDLTRPEEYPERCWDCGAGISRPGAVSLCVGTRSVWVNLCSSCAEQPRYRRCSACELTYTKHQTSLLVDQPTWWSSESSDPQFVCDYCAERDGLVTMKFLRRVERSERLFRDRYERIVDGMLRGELFRGPTT